MRLWVFKRHFSTIFQLYIDLWANLPGANMVQGRNTLGYLRTGKKVRLQIRIDHKMFDMFTSRNVKKIFKSHFLLSYLPWNTLQCLHWKCMPEWEAVNMSFLMTKVGKKEFFTATSAPFLLDLHQLQHR
jgi:hypothetical protein